MALTLGELVWQVVLCSNHVGQPVGPYQHPPDPDPTKLEMAQQQAKAMGLPPVKAKCEPLTPAEPGL